MASLADAYDALRTYRAYHSARSHVAAMEILKQRAGTFHDPVLVGNFETVISWHLPQE